MSLVRRNWARTDDYKTWPDGYPPALRYLIERASTVEAYKGALVNKTDNTFSRKVTLGDKDYWEGKNSYNRFSVGCFIAPGGYLRICHGGDMSKNSVEISAGMQTSTVRVITDTGLVAELNFATPDYLPNCRTKWFWVCIQVCRRGGNIELYVDGEGISEHTTTSKLLAKGRVSLFDADIFGNLAHCVCISNYPTSMHTANWAFGIVMVGYGKGYNTLGFLESDGLFVEVLGAKTVSELSKSTRNICSKNGVALRLCAENSESRGKYVSNGDTAEWAKPDGVRTVYGIFISRGGWGSPCIHGSTQMGDTNGTTGSFGRLYTRMISSPRATFCIPRVGDHAITNKYELPDGLTPEVTFNHEWWPYITEHAQPQFIGEDILNANVVKKILEFTGSGYTVFSNNLSMYVNYIGNSNPPFSGKISYWKDNIGHIFDNSNYTLKEEVGLKVSKYWMATLGAGYPGFKGIRRTYTVTDNGLHTYTETFPPIPPGPGAIFLFYKW